MKETHDRSFDLGDVGGPDPHGAERRGPRHVVGRAAVAMGLVVVAAMLAVGTIRVIAVDRSSHPAAAEPTADVALEPTYRHETPNPYEPKHGLAAPVAPVEVSDVDAAVDLRTGEVTPLPEPIARIAASAPHYALSPDGSSLAFVGITRSDGWQIHVADLDGAHVRAITTDASQDASPAWSPDGTEIAYEAGGYGEHHLAVVDVRTGRTRAVLGGSSGLDEWAWAPSFSPDGETIVFTVRWDSEELASDLWSVPARGGRPVRLLRYAAFVAFSPDGSSIAYRRARSMMSTWVRITDAAGHDPLHVGGSGWVWRPVWPILGPPAWSPDGTRIAFEGGSAGRIVVADVTSGHRQVIGPGERPTWLDDHTLIVEAVAS